MDGEKTGYGKQAVLRRGKVQRKLVLTKGSHGRLAPKNSGTVKRCLKQWAIQMISFPVLCCGWAWRSRSWIKLGVSNAPAPSYRLSGCRTRNRQLQRNITQNLTLCLFPDVYCNEIHCTTAAHAVTYKAKSYDHTMSDCSEYMFRFCIINCISL